MKDISSVNWCNIEIYWQNDTIVDVNGVNGEDSICRRKDGLWQCQAIVGVNGKGQPIRKTLYGKSRKEV